MHADTASVQCPYCGEEIQVVVDPSVEHQRYTEDCSVCCRPIVFTVTADAGEITGVDAMAEDEA